MLITNDGLIAKQALNEQELAEIKELSLLCNEFDQIDLKLNWNMLQNRPADQTNDFLFYRNGQLIGFAALYSFQSTEAELNGMVHPDYRRQGVFRQLVEAARQECAKRSIPKLIYIVEHTAAPAKAFALSTGAVYSFSEYWMKRVHDRFPAKKTDVTDEPMLRKAGYDDIESLVELNMSGFNMTEPDAREYAAAFLKSESDTTYIAEVNSKPVSKISVMKENGEAFIFGFCVQKELQGKGLGRQILAKTIQLQTAEGFSSIALEVAVENEGALALYQSCGFETARSYDYYSLAIE
ncbi:MAG: GNAT family N-acetyltransferase [Clostridia bacterium]